MSDAAVTTSTGSAAVSVAPSGSQDNWKYRRRFMIAMTFFCMAVIVACLFYGRPGIAETVVGSAFGMLVSIFGFYVAGTVWDDRSVRQFQTELVKAAKAPAPLTERPQSNDAATPTPAKTADNTQR